MRITAESILALPQVQRLWRSNIQILKRGLSGGQTTTPNIKSPFPEKASWSLLRTIAQQWLLHEALDLIAYSNCCCMQRRLEDLQLPKTSLGGPWGNYCQAWVLKTALHQQKGAEVQPPCLNRGLPGTVHVPRGINIPTCFQEPPKLQKWSTRILNSFHKEVRDFPWGHANSQ